MGRTMPVECDHGVIFDWGDFGPDPDDSSAGVEECPQCRIQDLEHQRRSKWGEAGAQKQISRLARQNAKQRKEINDLTRQRDNIRKKLRQVTRERDLLKQPGDGVLLHQIDQLEEIVDKLVDMTPFHD